MVELVINGKSRQSQDLLDAVLKACDAHGLSIDKKHIVKGEQIEKTLKAVKKRSPELLIIGGGDGTISNTLDMFAGTSVELGIIPLGTTNNFARSLALPLDVNGAIERIANDSSVEVDLGSVNKKLFANVTGIGLSADVASHISDKTKRRFGRLAYAIEGAARLFKHDAFTAIIRDKDGELELHFETHQLIIANGRYHAGKQIATDASLTSRELIIFALGGRSKLSFIRAMIDFYIGPRKSIRHSSYLIGRDVHIETSTPQPFELDGEVSFDPMNHSDVAVVPKAVKVRV